jgi:hypothetical protein
LFATSIGAAARGWAKKPVARSRLAAIGRKSLEVFCLGLFLSWGATQVLALAPLSWALDLGLTAVGMLALGVWARWLGRVGLTRAGVPDRAAVPLR